MIPEGCTGCGDCCRFMLIPLARLHGVASEKDFDRWLGLHGVEVVRAGGGRCAKVLILCGELDEFGRCRIYDSRPVMCRRGKCIKAGRQ